jgi:hypothetical protein
MLLMDGSCDEGVVCAIACEADQKQGLECGWRLARLAGREMA